MSGTDMSTSETKEDSLPKTSMTKDKALQLCQDLLGGAWMDISCEDMVFRTVTGGLSNNLFYCSLPESRNCDPREVIIREYGSFADANFILNESVIFTILSERKLGPKLHGMFPGGRIEEYIPALPLTHAQQRDPAISASIARRVAKVHNLHMPLNKKTNWIEDNWKAWMGRVYENVNVKKLSAENKALADNIFSHDLEKEFTWLRSFLAEVNSPVVLCHNDLQKGNILLPDGPGEIEDRIVLIDYEYCGYGNRGFDFALHFCEMAYDINAPVYPYFSLTDQGFPTKHEKLNFARAYLTAFGQASSEEDELRLVEEIDRYMLSAHLLTFAWSLCSAYTSKMKFGFFEHATTRLNDYFQLKEELLRRISSKEDPQEK